MAAVKRALAQLEQPDLPIAHPDTRWTGPVNLTVTAQARSETHKVAVYAFDTLMLNSQWELSGGLRWDRFEVDTLAFDRTANGTFIGYNIDFHGGVAP